MRLFRNPEVKKTLEVNIFLATIISIVAFCVSFQAGFFTVFVSVLLISVNIYYQNKRYNQIITLSKSIDKLLNGDQKVTFDYYSEGELSILQSEISKLTVKLKEQNESLLRDKNYLTDSIADISHQLKTPLTSINLILTFLSNPDLTFARRKELVKDLERLAQRIEWLISALLKISKIDAKTVRFQNELINCSKLMDKALEPLIIPMELREQKLIIHQNGNETFIGDFSWTQEALSNILKNCMEHTPINGTITILLNENPIYTEIVIKDTGTGIDPKDLPHIFERFYKGEKSSNQSVGIGLALARMIISEQKGTIKVENNIDCGSKFTIRFYKSIV